MGRHLTASELAELLGGSASSDLTAELFEHHIDVCEICRSRLADPSERAAPARSVEEVVARAVTLARERGTELEELRRKALQDFRTLMRLPLPARREKLNRAISRFRNPILVDLLLDECIQQVTRHPKEALALADCAFDAVFRVPETPFGRSWVMTALSRAHAFRGNALRVTGEFKQADESLLFALETFDRDGNGDPYVEAEILSFLASLRIDQRSFVEAEAYLDMARGIYDKIGDQVRGSRVLVKKSMLLFNAGDFDQALVVGWDALQAIDPGADPHLHLSAQHNYIAFLAEVGRYREAYDRLEENAARYATFPDSWTQLRREKLRGNILRGLGRRREAEEILAAVRSGFIAEGLGFHAAITGLDLAYLYVEEGRTREVRQLAEGMVPIFMAQDVHREAAAALMLFQEAARQECVTTSMLKELIAYMGRISARPHGRPA